MQFFAKAGFPCPSRRNPSDHFLRCINSDFDAVTTTMMACQRVHVCMPNHLFYLYIHKFHICLLYLIVNFFLSLFFLLLLDFAFVYDSSSCFPCFREKSILLKGELDAKETLPS